MDKTLTFLEKNSFAIALAAFAIAVVGMVYGSYDITYTKQMFSIIVVVYAALRLYQKYRTDVGDGREFKFLSRNHLGMLFGALLLLGCALGIYADLLVVSNL